VANAWALPRSRFAPSTMSKPNGWTPHLHGKVLNPCALANPFSDRTPSPDDSSEEPWSQPFVTKELEAFPDATETMYEAVLALWRLKMCGESGAHDADWLALMEAWLVSRPLTPYHVVRLLIRDRTAIMSSVTKPVPASSYTSQRIVTSCMTVRRFPVTAFRRIRSRKAQPCLESPNHRPSQPCLTMEEERFGKSTAWKELSRSPPTPQTLLTWPPLVSTSRSRQITERGRPSALKVRWGLNRPYFTMLTNAKTFPPLQLQNALAKRSSITYRHQFA